MHPGVREVRHFGTDPRDMTTPQHDDTSESATGVAAGAGGDQGDARAPGLSPQPHIARSKVASNANSENNYSQRVSSKVPSREATHTRDDLALPATLNLLSLSHTLSWHYRRSSVPYHERARR